MNERKKKALTKLIGSKEFGPFHAIMLTFSVVATVCVIAVAPFASFKSMTLLVIAIIAGAVFESKRFIGSWRKVGVLGLGAYCWSFIGFIPWKREEVYNLAVHIDLWPFYILAMYILNLVYLYREKVTVALGEGLTLLQSFAIVYWFVDYGFADSGNIFIKVIEVVGAMLLLFSVYNAFTPARLSRNSRFILSLWSSVIMAFLAIDYIYRVYQASQIDNEPDILDTIYIGLQYFVLGTSGVYIFQNISMLFGFLPSKKWGLFSEEYIDSMYELKQQHIERYSEDQVSIRHAFVCTLVAVPVFVGNYYLKLLPRHIVIWLLILVIPYLLSLFDYFENRNRG